MKTSMKLAVVFSALALAGCASTSQFDPNSGMNQVEASALGGLFSVRTSTYDRQRGLDEAAQVMLESDDIGLQATGQAILENTNGDVAQIGDTVREVIMEETTEAVSCEVTGVQRVGSGQQVNLGNCTPAPQ